MASDSKKNKIFFSLNAKIFLFLFLSVAGICSVLLSTFMLSYVRQLDRESEISRKKAEALYELFDENMRLRRAVAEMYNQLNTPETDTISKLWNDQNDAFYLKPLDDRYFVIRQELLRDMKGANERNNKVKQLGFFIFLGFLFVFVIRGFLDEAFCRSV